MWYSFEAAKAGAKGLVDGGAGLYALGVNGGSPLLPNLLAYAYSGDERGSYPAAACRNTDGQAELEAAVREIAGGLRGDYVYEGVILRWNATPLISTALSAGSTAGLTHYRYGGAYGNPEEKYGRPFEELTSGERAEYLWPDDPADALGQTLLGGVPKAVCVDGMASGEAGIGVQWSLGRSFRLEEGVSYVVSFTLWAGQAAGDRVADMMNGKTAYEDLSEEDQTQLYRDERDGAWKLRAGSARADFRRMSAAQAEGQAFAGGGQRSVYADSADMTVEAARFTLKKAFQDQMSEVQMAEIIEGFLRQDVEKKFSLWFDLMRDGERYGEEEIPLNGESPKSGPYDLAPGYQTVLDSLAAPIEPYVTVSSWASHAVDLPVGVAVSALSGVDGERAPKGVCRVQDADTGAYYYILAEGHDYWLDERAEGNMAEVFDYEPTIYHPMLVDGEVRDARLTRDGDGRITGISVGAGVLREFVAVNRSRAYVDIHQTVTLHGDKIDAGEQEFAIRVRILNEDGRGSENLWYARVSAEYADFERGNDEYVNRLERMETGNTAGEDGNGFEITLRAGEMARVFNVPGGATVEVWEVNLPDGYELDGYQAKRYAGAGDQAETYRYYRQDEPKPEETAGIEWVATGDGQVSGVVDGGGTSWRVDICNRQIPADVFAVSYDQFMTRRLARGSLPAVRRGGRRRGKTRGDAGNRHPVAGGGHG